MAGELRGARCMQSRPIARWNAAAWHIPAGRFGQSPFFCYNQRRRQDRRSFDRQADPPPRERRLLRSWTSSSALSWSTSQSWFGF